MNILIKTPHLSLREFAPEDWIAVHRYAADPEVIRHMNWGPNSIEDSQAFVTEAITLARAQPRHTYHLAVVERTSNQVVGGATLRMLDPVRPDAGELGYTLHRDTWGRGFGTELAQGLVQFGFMRLKLERIWATCRPDNLGSQRILLKKLGMSFEAFHKHERQVRGQWVDTLQCGLSRDEWLSARAAAEVAGKP